MKLRIFFPGEIPAERLHLPAVSVKYLDKPTENDADKPPETQENPTAEAMQEDSTPVVLSEKRKALFEPLEPMTNINGRRPSAEMLLPPPDFDAATYPKGWLIGKKRKLVNVDVVESMRRIAVQEMNRKVVFSVASLSTRANIALFTRKRRLSSHRM